MGSEADNSTLKIPKAKCFPFESVTNCHDTQAHDSARVAVANRSCPIKDGEIISLL
jgi:hypothetical protein